MSNNIKIIECPTCDANVSAHVIVSKNEPSEDVPCEVYLLQCPTCGGNIFAIAEMEQVDFDRWDMSAPLRLWPSPKSSISWRLPPLVKSSIEEASACLRVRAYSATVVMCGKALEAICKEHSIKNWKLQNGLKELKQAGIIDGRLFDWGEELRKSRNIGAHANDEKITAEDARDILDFTIAICDYVYVLSDKYNSFKDRQIKKKEAKKLN